MTPINTPVEKRIDHMAAELAKAVSSSFKTVGSSANVHGGHFRSPEQYAEYKRHVVEDMAARMCGEVARAGLMSIKETKAPSTMPNGGLSPFDFGTEIQGRMILGSQEDYTRMMKLVGQISRALPIGVKFE